MASNWHINLVLGFIVVILPYFESINVALAVRHYDFFDTTRASLFLKPTSLHDIPPLPKPKLPPLPPIPTPPSHTHLIAPPTSPLPEPPQSAPATPPLAHQSTSLAPMPQAPTSPKHNNKPAPPTTPHRSSISAPVVSPALSPSSGLLPETKMPPLAGPLPPPLADGPTFQNNNASPQLAPSPTYCQN